MTEENTAHANLPGLEPLLESVTQWVRLCRIALEARDELAIASPEEVARVAGELGVRTPEVAEAIADWSHQAALLTRMLARTQDRCGGAHSDG